ncbi:purine-nucleoside phosphorylase [Myxococcota bacterium]
MIGQPMFLLGSSPPGKPETTAGGIASLPVSCGATGRCSPMPELSEQIQDAVAAIGPLKVPPQVGMVLGSGLGGFADRLDELVCVEAQQIPHLPRSTVPGHLGRLCFGRVGQVRVVCLQGRVHLYEGYSAKQVVFGPLLLRALGCEAVLITNAAGGIAESLKPGSLMLAVDHINLTGHNPLAGPNQEPYPRFVSLTDAYDLELREAAIAAALASHVELHQGVYAGVLGPSYETPAEIGMLGRLGADAVGMSTVVEVIALRHRGVRVGALSLITNRAAGLDREVLSHTGVMGVAAKAEPRLARMMQTWIGLTAERLQG